MLAHTNRHETLQCVVSLPIFPMCLELQSVCGTLPLAIHASNMRPFAQPDSGCASVQNIYIYMYMYVFLYVFMNSVYMYMYLYIS